MYLILCVTIIIKHLHSDYTVFILLKDNKYVIIFLNIRFVYAYDMDKRFYRPPKMVDYMFSVVSHFLLLARIVRCYAIQMQLLRR